MRLVQRIYFFTHPNIIVMFCTVALMNEFSNSLPGNFLHELQVSENIYMWLYHIVCHDGVVCMHDELWIKISQNGTRLYLRCSSFHALCTLRVKILIFKKDRIFRKFSCYSWKIFFSCKISFLKFKDIFFGAAFFLLMY